jgi:hypothetical protein
MSEILGPDSNEILKRTVSEGNLLTIYDKDHYLQKRHHTSDDVTQLIPVLVSSTKHSKKTVTWNTTISAILIPTWKEFKELGILKDMIWWRDSDIADFEISSDEEIKNIVQRFHLTEKQAKDVLYQPNNENFFEKFY